MPVVLYVVSLAVTQPFVFPDEAGAILNARFLAGKGPRSSEWYLPGYGALLAPVLALTTDIRIIWAAVHFLNALLAGFTALGLYVAGRSFSPCVPAKRVVIAAVLTSFYPAYLHLGSLAMADNLLFAGSVWSVLAVDRIRRQPDSSSSYGLALLVGGFITVHSRASMIVLAAVVGLAVWPKTRRFAAVAAISATLALVAARSAIDTSQPSIFIGSRHGLISLLRANWSIDAVSTLPFTMLGQVLNLVASTLGLIVVGTSAVVKSAFGRESRARTVGIQISAMVSSTAILAALFTNGHGGDFAIYGRYLEAVVALPIFFGILHMLDRPLPKWFLPVVPVTVVLTGIVLVAIRGHETFSGRMNEMNFSGIVVIVTTMGRIDPIAIGLTGAVLAILIARVSLISRPAAALILVMAFFVNTTLITTIAASSAAHSATRNELSTDIHRGLELGAEPCVGLDQSHLIDTWGQLNYRVQNLDLEFKLWLSAENSVAPCRDMVVSTRRDLDDALPGWTPVAWERGLPHWLWVSPALLQRLGPLEAISPNPGTRLQSMEANLDVVLHDEELADGSYAVQVTITNQSSSTFVPTANLGTEADAVRLRLEWRMPGASDVQVHDPIIVDLIEPLRPASSQVVMAAIPSGPVGSEPHGWFVHAELFQDASEFVVVAPSADFVAGTG